MKTKITSLEQLQTLEPKTEIFKCPVEDTPKENWEDQDSANIVALMISKNNASLERLEYYPTTLVNTDLIGVETESTINYAPDDYKEIIDTGRFWIETE